MAESTNEPAKVPGARPPAPKRRRRWMIWLAVLGPGLIAANAGNDAGGLVDAQSGLAGGRQDHWVLWKLLLKCT